MSDRPVIPLTPVPVRLDDPAFAAITSWPFADPFVSRLLQTDIPRRVQFFDCRVWVYHDPDGVPVGFGTLDVGTDWAEFTGGRPHPYIPLLAVNPTIRSRGYGAGIVRHLADEAGLLVWRSSGCHDELFLDVYTTSDRAIRLYTEAGFRPVTDAPRVDPAEGGKEYIVMARRVAGGPMTG